MDRKNDKLLLKRFMDCVEIIPEHACWEWIGSKLKDSYGQLKVNNKTTRAHRLAYELFKGSIPKNMWLCHTCDNRGCVRPEHLFLGSPTDNVRDMINKGRNSNGNKIKTQCPQGHLYTKENTYRRGNSRKCKICTIKRSGERQKKMTASFVHNT
jgi:hypothetical protein